MSFVGGALQGKGSVQEARPDATHGRQVELWSPQWHVSSLAYSLLPILEPAWDLVRQRLDGHLFPSLRLRLLPSQQQEAEHRTLCPRVLTYWHGAGIAGVDRKILERTSYHQ
jgi:hypothetical protein